MPGFGKLDWGNWLYGLFAGFIGGGANAVTGGIVVSQFDPHDFNFSTGKFWFLLGSMFLVNGAMSAFWFLKQHPLPTIETVTTTITATQQEYPPSVTVQKVQEKVTKPADSNTP